MIDNLNCIEIAYIWLDSSYVHWGHLDSYGRFKPFKNEQISEIEDAFRKYEEKKESKYSGFKSIGKIEKFEVLYSV